MSINKPYSELSFAVDLVIEEYKTSNPIKISELIWENLGICISIHAISDYLDINRQNYELESKREYYKINY